jgi:hypothetical protein
MATQDPSLEELIVRALTSQDHKAHEALEAASREDAELKQFCDELNQVINTLAKCKDWRAEAPSATLREKVRQAVRAKMTQAPPRFQAVVLDADLGREKATRRLVYVLLAVLAAAALVALVLSRRPREEGGKLRLTGQRAFEAQPEQDRPEAWAAHTDDPADANLKALRREGSVNTIYLKNGFKADAAVALQAEIELPELDEKSSVMLFLADAAGAERPTLTSSARPEQALYLEITQDSIVLYEAGRWLHSKHISRAQGFYRLRLEYLGSQIRALVNDEPLFEGHVTQVLRGPLHPGLRAAGPQKSKFRLNGVWVER